MKINKINFGDLGNAINFGFIKSKHLSWVFILHLWLI